MYKDYTKNYKLRKTPYIHRTSSSVNILAAINFLFLVCITSCSEENCLRASYNNCMKSMFGYEAIKDRTKEVEELFAKENKTEYEKRMRENIGKINVVNAIEFCFAIDSEVEYLVKALKDGMHVLSDVIKCANEPFLMYTQTEDKLFCIGSVLPKDVHTFKVDPQHISIKSNYFEYEIAGPADPQTTNKAAESGDYNLKESYKIKFAGDIEVVEEYGKKFIRLYSNSCLSLFDQDIDLYKVDQFENGLVGYYRSYLFRFEIAHYFGEEQCRNASSSFKPYSLENLRESFPEYKTFIQDITRIEDDISFKNLLSRYFVSLPVILWIFEQDDFNYFLSENLKKNEIDKIVNELKEVYAVGISTFFIDQQTLGKEDTIFQLFLRDLVKELENEAKINNICLEDKINRPLREFITSTKKLTTYECNQLHKSQRSFIYNDCLLNLKSLFRSIDKEREIKTFVINCFVKSSKILTQSYSFLNEAQVEVIQSYMEKASIASKGSYASCFKQVEDVLNGVNKKNETTYRSLLCLQDADIKYKEDHDILCKVLDDMKKKVGISFYIHLIYFYNRRQPLEKMGNLVRALLQTFDKKLADDDIEHEKRCLFLVQVHILLCSLKHGFSASMSERQVKILVIECCPGLEYTLSNRKPGRKFKGDRYQYELFKQYASLKKFLEARFGTYIASILMRHYDRKDKLHKNIDYYVNNANDSLTANEHLNGPITPFVNRTVRKHRTRTKNFVNLAVKKDPRLIKLRMNAIDKKMKDLKISVNPKLISSSWCEKDILTLYDAINKCKVSNKVDWTKVVVFCNDLDKSSKEIMIKGNEILRMGI